MSTTTSIASPEVLAAQDVRVLDIIEDMLLDQTYDATMTDDLVLAIQEYMQDEKANKSALALIADNAKLRSVFKLTQQIRNSDAFLALVAENTPVELPIPTKPPVQVVATGTTATAIAQQSQSKAEEVISHQSSVVSKKPAKGLKSPKKSNEAKAPKTPKAKVALPMPTIADMAQLQAMDRKSTIEAFKALKSNYETELSGVRANAATAVLKQQLAGMILLEGYVEPAKPVKAPKASSKKPKKQEPILELPEGLSWEEVKNMKYRQLQQLGKIFRSQGHEMPRLNSKGDDIRKAIANAMRSQGHDITEVAIASQGPAKDLHLPNWGAVKEQKRLERVATEALRMDATDAKVHMELAVAA